MRRLSLALLIIIFCFVTFGISFAENNDEIERRNAEIKRLEAEIAKYESALAETSRKSNTLKTHIKELDLTQKKLSTNIALTTNKVKDANKKINKLEDNISLKEESIDKSSKAIALLINKMNERSNISFAETILANGDITDVWRDVDSYSQIEEDLSNHIESLRGTKKKLEFDKMTTEEIKQKLVSLQTELADEKKIIKQNISEKSRILTVTKNQESTYKSLLEEKKARKAELDAEIRAFESKLKYNFDPQTLPVPGTPVFSWPLKNIYITQMFGRTVAAKRLYASGSHSGIDLRASVGTPVMSMGRGVVEGTGDTDLACRGASFGKWIYIKYDNGLATAFGHLSLIKVTEGQRVNAGDLVGYSGQTGHATGPHLHVTVYDGRASKVGDYQSKSCKGAVYHMPFAPTAAYLDPLLYLPKR